MGFKHQQGGSDPDMIGPIGGWCWLRLDRSYQRLATWWGQQCTGAWALLSDVFDEGRSGPRHTPHGDGKLLPTKPDLDTKIIVRERIRILALNLTHLTPEIWHHHVLFGRTCSIINMFSNVFHYACPECNELHPECNKTGGIPPQDLVMGGTSLLLWSHTFL